MYVFPVLFGGHGRIHAIYSTELAALRYAKHIARTDPLHKYRRVPSSETGAAAEWLSTDNSMVIRVECWRVDP